MDTGRQKEEDLPIADEWLETSKMACVCICSFEGGLGLPGLALLRVSKDSRIRLEYVRLLAVRIALEASEAYAFWGPLDQLGTGGGGGGRGVLWWLRVGVG